MSQRHVPSRRSRRDFLREAGAASLLVALTPTRSFSRPAQEPAGPPVRCAVIGTGLQGREILGELARLGGAPVTAVCDTLEVARSRGQETAPDAAAFEDYRRALEAPDVQAVFVATPTHTHREIVEAALQAGKHVYCEAPLAHTVADAQAIARAARDAAPLFQAGLQNRANPLHQHVEKFIRGGVLGTVVQARMQFNRKLSWRRASPDAARERLLNWRLDPELSLGLAGEIGIHQFDVASWYLREPPRRAVGFGSVRAWQDGRTVPDTIQCILEYGDDVRATYNATLGNSFEGTSDLLQGDHNAVLMRGQEGWLVKEADAPFLGWELYAKQEHLGDATGIALVADATQIIERGGTPKDHEGDGRAPLSHALEHFLQCVREEKPPVCGAEEGLEATVVGLKVNEAIVTGEPIQFQPEWFRIP